MQRVVARGGEASYFVWGSENNGHHKADFDVRPEAMEVGLGVFRAMLKNLNGCEKH